MTQLRHPEFTSINQALGFASDSTLKAVVLTLFLSSTGALLFDQYLPFLGMLRALTFVAFLVPAVTLVLFWRVSSRVAGGVFVTALWLMLSWMVIVYSSVNSIVFLSYLLVIYLAALILPPRLWMVLLLAGMLVGFGTVVLRWQGAYTPRGFGELPPLSTVIVPFGILLVGGLLVYAGTRQIALAFALVRRNSDALIHGRKLLEERSTELAATNARLQLEIDEREQNVLQLQMMETALQRSERRYELIFENDPSAIILSDIETGVLIDVNDSAVKLFGYEREELLSKVLHALVVDSAENDPTTTPTSSPHVRESMILNAYGEKIPAEIRCVTLADANGRELRQSSIVDITERHYALRALRESEERYRTLVENAPEALLVVDTHNHCFVEVNEKAAELFGLTRIELLSRSVEDVLTLPDETPTLDALARAAKGKDAFTLEATQRLGGGREFSAELYITKLPAGSRHFIRVSVFDISRRKELERQRRREKEQLELLVSSLPGSVAITSADEHGTILWANEEMHARHAHENGELVGTSIVRFYSDPAIRQRIIEQVKQTGSIRNVEFEAQRPNGEHYWVRCSVAAIEYDGRPALLGVIDDIDEEKRRQTSDRQAQKLEGLGVLAGGIAHDFNNLLVAILGQSTLALRKLEEEHPARSHIQKSADATRRAAQLTKQILAYSGRGSFELREINLNDILRDSYQLFDTTLPSHVTYEIELGKFPPLVKADPTQMQQLIMNLLLHAAQATPAGKKVYVKTAQLVISSATQAQFTQYTGSPLRPGSYLSLKVTDSGGRLSAEARERLFDPFAPTTFSESSGLELAAVLGIVRGHHGGLRVLSDPQHGTSIELIIPASNASKVEYGAVLVIDNEYAVREAVSDILTADGVAVLTADGGRDGLARFAEQRGQIALVLLDDQLTETLDGLRDIDPSIPVLVSADVATNYPKKANACIEKPYDAATLTSEVRRLLTR